MTEDIKKEVAEAVAAGSKEIVIHQPSPDETAWNLIKKQALVAFNSGLLPKHIDKPEKAAIIMLKGRELGISPMHALASITVIQGKPALSGELMLALIYKNVKGARVTFLTPHEKSHEECEVEFQRPGGVPQRFKFSMEDARRAGLLANPSWIKYPAAMLRARVISAMARACAPDAIMGCYTPEELGGEHEPDEHDAPVQLTAKVEPMQSSSKAEQPKQAGGANNRFK